MTKTKIAKILLVEDNPGDVRLTQEAFRESKITVDIQVAGDGVEALAYLHRQLGLGEQMPDFVLLDLNLPRMDGREVLREMKSDPRLRLIPVLILTTSNARQDIMEAYKLHVNCYINKPVDFDDFFKIVQHIEEFWLNTAILPSRV